MVFGRRGISPTPTATDFACGQHSSSLRLAVVTSWIVAPRHGLVYGEQVTPVATGVRVAVDVTDKTARTDQYSVRFLRCESSCFIGNTCGTPLRWYHNWNKSLGVRCREITKTQTNHQITQDFELGVQENIQGRRRQL